MTLSLRLRFLGVTLAVVAIDRASKAWFETQTVLGWRHELIRNFAYLVHTRNPGIAFGFLGESSAPWVRHALIAGSVLLIAALAWIFVTNRAGGKLSALALALLLGGATGNVTDRVLHGAVTDFFELWFGTYRYPAFNVADSAIFLGAMLMLIDVLFPARPAVKEA